MREFGGFCMIPKRAEFFYSYCQSIFRQTPRSLVSLSRLPTVLYAYFNAQDSSLSEELLKTFLGENVRFLWQNKKAFFDFVFALCCCPQCSGESQHFPCFDGFEGALCCATLPLLSYSSFGNSPLSQQVMLHNKQYLLLVSESKHKSGGKKASYTAPELNLNYSGLIFKCRCNNRQTCALNCALT